MKIKNLFAVGILMLIALNNYAQDLLVKHNGEVIKCKILEISPEQIKYKRFNNLEGPSYVLNKADVLSITYENGETEILQEETTPTEKKSSEKRPQNLVSFGAKEAFDGSLYLGGEVAYERINKKGNFGFRIASFTLFQEGLVSSNSTIMFKFYLNSGKVRFFLGPGILSGYDYEWGVGVVGFGGTLGLSFELNDTLNLTFGQEGGYAVEMDEEGESYPMLLGSLMLGFRF